MLLLILQPIPNVFFLFLNETITEILIFFGTRSEPSRVNFFSRVLITKEVSWVESPYYWFPYMTLPRVGSYAKHPVWQFQARLTKLWGTFSALTTSWLKLSFNNPQTVQVPLPVIVVQAFLMQINIYIYGKITILKNLKYDWFVHIWLPNYNFTFEVIRKEKMLPIYVYWHYKKTFLKGYFDHDISGIFKLSSSIVEQYTDRFSNKCS
jgi:hypothetical protein